MTEEELLRKIDRTLERNTEAFERSERRAAESQAQMRQERQESHEWIEEQRRESRAYLDEFARKQAGITQAMIDSMQAFFAQLQAEIADQREQIQASTAALLKVLDRLDAQEG